MANAVCSKCDVGWVIHSHDKYCGFCGCKVFDFSVKWKEEPWIYTDDSANIRDLTILIENAGAYPITFHPIRTSRDNTIQFPDVNDKPFEVKAGEFRAVQIQVNPTNLARFAETIAVRAKDAPSNFESKKSLTLQALPLPEFTITPSLVPLSYPKSKEKDTINFKVEFQEEQFPIESIESSNEWIIGCNLSEAPRNICLEIDCTKLKAGRNSETLSFKLHGPSKPIEKQIQVQANIEKEPAELSVVGEELEVIQNRENSHTFRLRNKGEKPLTITKIKCDDSSNLIKLQNDECPIIIEGVKQQNGENKQQDEAAHNIDILISTVGIDPGTYPINFKIHSNCHIAPEYHYTLNVTVKERKEYPYYLALDFGTTNSCCAYIDDKTYDLKLLPLEDSGGEGNMKPSLPESMIMSSSIIYRAESENGTDYDVGAKAETDRTDTRDGPYFISSVKRWLGYQWHRQFPGDQQLQPVDVVSHILKHIINKAEDYLEQQNIPSKITRCAVTHPTKFNTKQQDALRKAFESIGITDLILIDEASAASMGIIFENYDSLPEDYRLLVYDFGGGTIDIALSQVTKNGDDITIEPIARDGDPKYGGDNVTQAIVDYVLNEYRRRIEEISPGHNFDIPYFGPGQILKPSRNPNIDNATRENSAVLYRRAEEMKKEFVTLSETRFTLGLNIVESTPQHLSDFVRKILAENIQDENMLTERTQSILDVKLSEDQFQQIIEPALNKTFAAIDTMIAENGERLPDLIVLAGQSSRMRFVKEIMAAHFKDNYSADIEICLDEHPKKCVVMGAAQYSLTYSLSDEEGGKVQIINLSNKTHTRLGIARRVGLRPIFGEIIPKGKLIPDESYGFTKLPLRTWMTPINVLEHFGSDDSLDENQVLSIHTYNLDLSKSGTDISDEELGEAQLKMAVKVNGEIELTAIVGDDEHLFTVEKEKPEFVDEIPQTTSVIEMVEQQPTSPYQQEVEEVIRDAQQRVMELERSYRDGEPIDLDNIYPSTPNQKVLLNLNTIARDLSQWTKELKQDGQTDILQTLRYVEAAIKNKLKTIRGQAIPSPKTLELSTDVSTDTEVTHIRNECADYLEEYKSMLRKFELECEVDPSVCEQLVRNQLFNNLARYMPPDSLSEKLDKFLQLVDLEIVPIKIGETEVDSRIHDIQGSKKTNVDAGTVAEVIIPGLMQKTDSAIVQKPVVIRGE